MTVGLCRVQLHLPENHSLKGKRQVIKSLIARIQNRFNVSVAEIDEHDRWQMAALETLAIIAYKQPITRMTIESIRGVNCDQVIASLKARGLIAEVGRAHAQGRPYLFGTTFRFLEYFGLEKPEDLPPLREAEAEPED